VEENDVVAAVAEVMQALDHRLWVGQQVAEEHDQALAADHGGELVLPGGGTPVQLGRYLAKEDDLRDDLNAYAAELETMDFSPNSPALMQHVVQTKQLVTLRRPLDHADEATLDRLCLEAVGFLAANTDGVYQIDGQGWFAADGKLLLQEY
jgi:hypothetical protein